MIWICFIIIFFAAFQLVLLYLFGKGVIAVDMFLNLVTTNPGEAMELLDNLVPAVAGVFIVYLPLLILRNRIHQKQTVGSTIEQLAEKMVRMGSLNNDNRFGLHRLYILVFR